MIGLAAVTGQKGSDGFTDEERPYEFGFNIEGYQHRHEKKGLSKHRNRVSETAFHLPYSNFQTCAVPD
jgi:hypothetical protein